LYIAGLTGEKTIYRRRAEKEPEMGTPQTKPKRLKLVIDVSGSMYRLVYYFIVNCRICQKQLVCTEKFCEVTFFCLYDYKRIEQELYIMYCAIFAY
jgi:hypothetical protein